MKFKRVMAVYGDLHTGSAFAILPPNFKNKKGNTIHLNEGQEKLLVHWEKCKRLCDKFKVDTIVLIGDLIHGLNYKQSGEGLLLPELEEQKEAVKSLLKPLCKGREVMGITGTHYHDSRDTRTEKDIIEALGGSYHGYVINGEIKGTNRTVNIIHGKSKATVYRETSASREMLFFKEAEALEKLGRYDVFYRGHNHFFLHIHKRSAHYVINPCWQVLEPNDYTMTNYAKWQPDIGMSMMLIDEDDRIHIWHFLLEEQIHIMDMVKNI